MAMLDLNDRALTRVRKAQSPIPSYQDDSEQEKVHPLDTDVMIERHKRLLDFWVTELERQAPNRREMAIDEDYYDNDQWRAEDKAELKDRGQEALVYNVIATTVNWVIGTERRGRADFKVLPRRKEMAKPAEKKTALLKYLSDANRTPFSRSHAFEDAIKCGVGWLECGVEDDSDGEPLYARYESWRNVLYDSTAMQLDLADARYIMRAKWVDLDIAIAMFPDREALLRRAANDGDQFFFSLYGDDAMDFAEEERNSALGFGRHHERYHRPRVRIIEAWFTAPAKVGRLKGGDFHGELFDEASPGHMEAVDSGQSEVRNGVTMRMHVALFTTQGLLWHSPSPYRHNRFPFTPIWAYRRGRDGLPYGMIRGLRGIQEDINKRAVKSLHLLLTKGVIAEEGAFGAAEDDDEARQEFNRPDFWLKKKKGADVEIISDRDLTQWHLELMGRSITMIQQASGVTDENLGRQTNATSGIAIGRRQDQGSTTTTKLFDNLRFASQVFGEKELANVEQFVSEQRQFRITNMRGSPDYITVNSGAPDDDITRSKADFVISEADWRASVRQAAADELMDLLGKLAPVAPQIAMVVLDLVVESMDIQSREEIVKRIRQATGQRDPDAGEPTPEEMQQMQAKQQQQQLQMAMAAAALRKETADAAAQEAKAKNLDANTVKTNIASMGGPKRGAEDIAVDLMTAPEIAAVADEILKQAGFVSRAEMDQAIQTAIENAKQQQAAQPRPPAPAQQPQQPQPAPPAAAAPGA